MSLVTLFIIICCASTLHKNGVSIKDAKDAAMALKPLAGANSSILFGIGLFNASIFFSCSFTISNKLLCL